MKIIASIIAIFLFSISAYSQTVLADSDFQFRNNTSISFPLIKAKDKNEKEFEKLSVSINGTLRFGGNVLRPIDERIGVSFDYRVNRHISLGPEIFYRVTQPTRNRKDYETRFRFAFVLENKWKKFSLSDRNLIEYRLRNSRRDSVRYRNRLRFSHPFIKAERELFTPFVSHEIFYDFQAKTLTRNEFFAGITKKVNKNLAAGIYYLFGKDKNFPKTINGIGVNLKFKVN